MPTCHQQRKIVDDASTHFVRVTKIKTAAKIMMVKRLARNNLLIKLIQNEDGFFETKKNNKNKKSFIGFKSVAYLSSIKTRFNRSVARTVLFFCFSILLAYECNAFVYLVFFLAQRDARPIHCNCMPFVKCILLNIRSR